MLGIAPDQFCSVEEQVCGNGGVFVPPESQIDPNNGLQTWLWNVLPPNPEYCPPSIPTKIIDAYLSDLTLIPLFDCVDCGLQLPTRNKICFFETCPDCGGKTGLNAFTGKDHPTAEYLTEEEHASVCCNHLDWSFPQFKGKNFADLFTEEINHFKELHLLRMVDLGEEHMALSEPE